MFFSFLQDKMCGPEKSCASQRLCAYDSARSTSGAQFVQAINRFVQLSTLFVYSLKMITGKCNRKVNVFMKCQLELFILSFNTMLKLLVISFMMKIILAFQDSDCLHISVI